jgi:hypothetical protein
MNIATQGGKLILKDGKLAESCGCCEQGGEWYCCASRSCLADNITSIQVSITAEDWHYYSGFQAAGFRGSALTSPFTLPRMVVTSSFVNFGTPPIYGISQLLAPAFGLVELSLTVSINDCSDSFSWALAVAWKNSTWNGSQEDFTRDKLWASGSFQFPNYNQSVVTGTSSRGLAPISSSGSAQIDLSSINNRPLIIGNPLATFSVSIT